VLGRVINFYTILDFGLGKLCTAMVSVCELPRPLLKSVLPKAEEIPFPCPTQQIRLGAESFAHQ
jgi:hypothetical protein